MRNIPGLAIAFTLATATLAAAQGQRAVERGPAAELPKTLKAAAPIDLAGTWVSVITEDWRWRMMTPPRYDYAAIPLNAHGREVADNWDPRADETDNLQCKIFGAVGVMRQPGRLKIEWTDDNTLRVDTDAGTQTRVFQFGKPAATPGKRTWQGNSVAIWEARSANNQAKSARYLKVTTTNMLAGYLRKNGVPYGDSAVLTEYYDLFQERDGTTMMFVTAVVQDPVYLEQRYIVISHFRKEPDGSKWDPSPCSARW